MVVVPEDDDVVFHKEHYISKPRYLSIVSFNIWYQWKNRNDSRLLNYRQIIYNFYGQGEWVSSGRLDPEEK